MNRIRTRLTYANVISSLALFLVLAGGTAFAASQLGKNSVGSKQLQKNAVTQAKIKKEAVVGAKIKKGAITGAKVTNDSLTGTQINEGSLGTVPSANSANVAGSLTAPEGLHLVGTAGNPSFENGSSNYAEAGIALQPVGYWKDKEGVVHMQGVIKFGKPGTSIVSAFTLPAGFRPAPGAVSLFELIDEAAVIIGGSNTFLSGLELSGKVVGTEEKFGDLEGVTFRAGS